MKVRNGSEVNDPRLGWVYQHDDRNQNYPVRTLHTAEDLRRKTWRLNVRLNQGQTPTCVGHAFTHEYAAAPDTHRVGEADAIRWYHIAQDNDEWAGSDYGGSSTLGGVKAGVAQGFYKEYRWAFSLDEAVRTVSTIGPMVVGSNWHRQMFTPSTEGFVFIEGPVDGGHEWMLRGVDPKRAYFLATNSWGRDWGINGDFKISFEDFNRLVFQEQGDCVYIVHN